MVSPNQTLFEYDESHHSVLDILGLEKETMRRLLSTFWWSTYERNRLSTDTKCIMVLATDIDLFFDRLDSKDREWLVYILVFRVLLDGRVWHIGLLHQENMHYLPRCSVLRFAVVRALRELRPVQGTNQSMRTGVSALMFPLLQIHMLSAAERVVFDEQQNATIAVSDNVKPKVKLQTNVAAYFVADIFADVETQLTNVKVREMCGHGCESLWTRHTVVTAAATTSTTIGCG